MNDHVSRPIIDPTEWSGVNVELTVRAQQLYAQYAWAVDYGDFELLQNILAPDIAITRGDTTYQGLDEFLQVYHNNWAADWSAGKHYISNVIGTQDSDGNIRSRAYFQAVFVRSNRTSMVVGRYDDSLVEMDGSLLIAHKRIHVEGSVELPEVSRDWNGYQYARVK